MNTKSSTIELTEQEIIGGKNTMNKNISKNKMYNTLQNAWDTIHRYGLWLSMFCMIGVYVGVMVSKTYYSSKMEESILIGGFVHDKKVYAIIPK